MSDSYARAQALHRLRYIEQVPPTAPLRLLAAPVAAGSPGELIPVDFAPSELPRIAVGGS